MAKPKTLKELRKSGYRILPVREELRKNLIGKIKKKEPLFADISGSLELGYTYGIYELTIKSKEANPQVHKGTYLTIWKKDKYGNWKFVLDTGNSGLGEK